MQSQYRRAIWAAKPFLRSLRELRRRRYAARVAPKVDFVVAGTQKGGTTALDRYLRAHPQVCMARVKEVRFFDEERHFEEFPNYALYHSFFDRGPQHRVAGEATPNYMYWADTPRRLWQYNPALKLIVVLRNPLERAYSHWNMQSQLGLEPLSFHDALRAEPSRAEGLGYQDRVSSYVDRGRYAEQLRRLWVYFRRDQTLILRHEDLLRCHNETLRTVFGFLAVAEVGEVAPLTANARAYASSLGEPERRHLRTVFEHEIKELERLLHWDCSEWLR